MSFDWDFLEQRQSKSNAHKSSAWLLSYGDLITQLLVFFIVIVSISKISSTKLSQIQSGLKGQEVAENPLVKIQKDLEDVLAKHGLKDSVDVKQDADGISMIIKDSLLFASGEADISSHSAQMLEPIFIALKELPAHYRFSIEGHTDDAQFSKEMYVTNWQLSADRAIAVLELFEKNEFSSKRLSIHGYGEYQPLSPNRDASGNIVKENQARNRRVVIRVR